MTVGVLAAVPTALSGAADWVDTNEEPRRIGLVHALLNSSGLLLVIASLLARRGHQRGLGVGLSTLGLSLVTVSAWLGGELVYRLGTGVSRIAFDPPINDFVAVARIDALEEGKLTAAAANARASAGQPLLLGAASVLVQSVQRNQDLTTNNRGGPPGSFTVLDVVLQNSGAEPISPDPSNFRLLDDRGRAFAIDAEATRSTNSVAHRRNLFDASVPPGGQLSTYLAFETPPDSNASSLRVQLGYGEAELPRQ